jgi:hypothetical protein
LIFIHDHETIANCEVSDKPTIVHQDKIFLLVKFYLQILLDSSDYASLIIPALSGTLIFTDKYLTHVGIMKYNL